MRQQTPAVDSRQQPPDSDSGRVVSPGTAGLQITPTMCSSHSAQPKNSSIPQSLVFPQLFCGGQLYLESANNDFSDCRTTEQH